MHRIPGLCCPESERGGERIASEKSLLLISAALWAALGFSEALVLTRWVDYGKKRIQDERHWCHSACVMRFVLRVAHDDMQHLEFSRAARSFRPHMTFAR